MDKLGSLRISAGSSGEERRVADFLIVFFILVVSVVPLYSLISSYVYGDQVGYREFYERLANVSNLAEVFLIARATISSHEVISPLVLWVGSYIGVDKDIYITFLNLVMLASLVMLLRRNGANWLVVLLCLTNFYLMVLYTGAERLKIGYMLVFLSALSAGKVRGLLAFFSVLAHFQMLILVLGFLFYSKGNVLAGVLTNFFMRFKVRLKHLYGFLFALALVTVFVSIPGVLDGIISKGLLYIERVDAGFGQLFQYCAVLIALVIAKRFRVSIGMLAMCLFFLVSILLLGGSRVNMIFYSSVFAVLLFEKRLDVLNSYCWPFLLIMLYLSVKSIGFIAKIYRYGNGFYGI